MHTKEDLRMLQALPLDLKVAMTQERIRAWANYWGEGGVCVSFSGGKDSTVLLHIVRELYPDVRAVFSNTGLEYPEIRQFAMSHDNVDMVYPDMGFMEVLTTYGYPLISKEVAEAIYYARRIGGGAKRAEQNERTSRRKRNEINPHANERCEEQKDSPQRVDGGGGMRKRNDYNRSCLQPPRNDPRFYNTAPMENLSQGREKKARTPRVQSRGDAEYF